MRPKKHLHYEIAEHFYPQRTVLYLGDFNDTQQSGIQLVPLTCRVPKAQSAVLDNTPVSMLFAILVASAIAQKNVAERQYIIRRYQPGRDLVPTCAFSKRLRLRLNSLRQRLREKNSKSLRNREISAGTWSY